MDGYPEPPKPSSTSPAPMRRNKRSRRRRDYIAVAFPGRLARCASSRSLAASLSAMKRISNKTLALLRNRHQAAIELANRAAEAGGRHLADYRKPKVTFYRISTKGAWSVFYASRFPTRPADSFYIVVDAATHATKFSIPDK